MNITEFENHIEHRMPGAEIIYPDDGSIQVKYKGEMVKSKRIEETTNLKNVAEQLATKMYFILHPEKTYKAKIPATF